jgi:FkbH-like protein
MGPAGEPDGRLSSPVKMIVWDLDDTLWAGTLSEGPVTIDPSVAELIRTLNRRGIVSSICSKNDRDAARAQLEQSDLWDEFVFARIDWSPKGPRVAEIIDEAQLRPQNILFIDDLAINRAEVRHFSPEVQTAAPSIMEQLLSLPELAGKEDDGLTRLEQYRLLERKSVDRSEAEDSNEAFLRSCDIRVSVHRETDVEEERLFELVGRTNQLNFTKRRPERAPFQSMLADPRYETGYVRVRDRYGDYGIAGFYSLSIADRSLVDFLFSCRVLNMGVEQWLYERLGRPSLSVVGEVASVLEGSVDWITEETGERAATSAGETAEGVPSTPVQTEKILMVGGCDLMATAEYLGGTIATDFSRVGANGTFIHVGHTELLRQSVTGLSDEQLALVDRIPFLDREVFQSPVVVDPDYDVLVYSVLTDYTQGVYRHRGTGLLVPWHQFNHDVTQPGYRGVLEARFAREKMEGEFFDWFTGEFEFLGGTSVERFEENIRWLATRVPGHARIVFLNGAEFPLDNPKEPDRHLRHWTMNGALDRVVGDLPNASVCDVRTFVLSADDVTDNIRHYRRRAYLRMAEEIRAANLSTLRVEPEHVGARLYGHARRFVGRRRIQARRLSKRLRGIPVSPPR